MKLKLFLFFVIYCVVIWIKRTSSQVNLAVTEILMFQSIYIMFLPDSFFQSTLCIQQTYNFGQADLPSKLLGNLMFFTFNLKGSSPLKKSAKENTVTVHSQKPRRPLKLIEKENAIFEGNNMDDKRRFAMI